MKAEDARIQALHRCAKDLDMRVQSCLQLLPLTSTELVSPTQLVVLPFACRTGLFCELIHNFVKRALYSLQWPIQRSHMFERQFIFLYGPVDSTLL